MARHVPHASNPLLNIKLPAYRSRMTLLILALAFLALGGRAIYLQLMTSRYLQKEGGKRYEISFDVQASRGKIVDRNGVVLASSLPARAICAVPGKVEVSPDKLRELARLLDMPVRDLSRKLDEDEKTFIYLKRQVDADVALKIAALKIPGILQRVVDELIAHFGVIVFGDRCDRVGDLLPVAREVAELAVAEHGRGAEALPALRDGAHDVVAEGVNEAPELGEREPQVLFGRARELHAHEHGAGLLLGVVLHGGRSV